MKNEHMDAFGNGNGARGFADIVKAMADELRAEWRTERWRGQSQN